MGSESAEDRRRDEGNEGGGQSRRESLEARLRLTAESVRDKGHRALDASLRAGRSAAVTAAVAVEAADVGSGLLPAPADTGSTRIEAPTSQSVERPSGSRLGWLTEVAEGAVGAAHAADVAKDRVGLSQEIERLADHRGVRDEQLLEEIRRDHGRPQSSERRDPP